MTRQHEVVVLYEPSDVPLEVRFVLPSDAGPHRCLFWIARSDSPAVAALFEAIDEPDIDHVDQGMELAELVAFLAARGRALADIVRPEEVGDEPEYLGTYTFGFHTGPRDQVRAFLQAHATVASLSDVLADLLLVKLDQAELILAYTDALRPVECARVGWFVIEHPSYPLTLHGFGGDAHIDARPASGCVELALEPPRATSRDDCSEDRDISEALAASLVSGIFQADPVLPFSPDGAESIVFTTDRCPEEGFVETVLCSCVDGRFTNLAVLPLPLVPALPTSERRYHDYLTAVRAAWVEDLSRLPTSPDEIIDPSILDNAELQTFEDFRDAVFSWDRRSVEISAVIHDLWDRLHAAVGEDAFNGPVHGRDRERFESALDNFVPDDEFWQSLAIHDGEPLGRASLVAPHRLLALPAILDAHVAGLDDSFAVSVRERFSWLLPLSTVEDGCCYAMEMLPESPELRAIVAVERDGVTPVADGFTAWLTSLADAAEVDD